MSSSSYPPSRRDYRMHTHHTHPAHPYARQFQSSQFRTITTMHGTPTPSLSSVTPNAPRQEPSFFEESYPHERGSFQCEQLHQWPEQQHHSHYNFRPTNTHETNFAGFTTVDAPDATTAFATIARKPEGLSLPALPYQVDASQYENLDYGEYMMTSTDLEASSPESTGTTSIGPQTPVSPAGDVTGFRRFYDDAYLVNKDEDYVAKVESGPFASLTSASLSSSTPNPLHTQYHLPLSMIYGDAQTVASAHAFTRHTHTHGGLVTNMPSFQDYITPAGQMSAALSASSSSSFSADGSFSAARSVDISVTDSMPDLERSMLDGSTGEDTDAESEQSTSAGPEGTVKVPNVTMDELANLSNRDKYLLNMRAKGISYKEIKRRGRFHEAESTLRGRIRVMTKHKSERVRKPVWTRNDVRLLEQALDNLADGDSTSGRTPWKKIGDWMKEHGSSYHFAGATCAKKWKSMYE